MPNSDNPVMSSGIAAPSATVAACITVTPDRNGYVPLEDCRNEWPYYPSFGAAILFSILFGVTTVTHIVQARLYCKRFCWVIIMAGIWETTGFVLRILSTRNQISMGLYIPEELFILLAPIWINAFVYMTLGRMVYYFLPERKVLGITATKLARYFVCMDILSFAVQAVGGSMASGGTNESPDAVMAGIHVYMAGIGLQEFFIILFVSLAVAFHFRMLFLEKSGALVTVQLNPSWRPLLYTVYGALVLITIRIIFRLVQYSAGVLTYIPTHEVFIYCFEALPMLVSLFLLNFAHPGRYLIGPGSEYPKKSRQQKREERREKKFTKKARKEQKRAAMLFQTPDNFGQGGEFLELGQFNKPSI